MPEPHSSFGDKSKRTCQFYATCKELKEIWDDERGTQLECDICGAAVFAQTDDEA